MDLFSSASPGYSTQSDDEGISVYKDFIHAHVCGSLHSDSIRKYSPESSKHRNQANKQSLLAWGWQFRPNPPKRWPCCRTCCRNLEWASMCISSEGTGSVHEFKNRNIRIISLCLSRQFFLSQIYKSAPDFPPILVSFTRLFGLVVLNINLLILYLLLKVPSVEVDNPILVNYCLRTLKLFCIGLARQGSDYCMGLLWYFSSCQLFSAFCQYDGPFGLHCAVPVYCRISWISWILMSHPASQQVDHIGKILSRPIYRFLHATCVRRECLTRTKHNLKNKLRSSWRCH